MSSSIRIDGLDGLMELIKNNESAILEDHLSFLLNKIAPMATDRESKIRKLANSIFSTIVKQVSSKFCNTMEVAFGPRETDNISQTITVTSFWQ